jgi:WD40 repeat protein
VQLNFHASASKVTLALLLCAATGTTLVSSGCSGSDRADPYIKPTAGSGNLGGAPDGGTDPGTGSKPSFGTGGANLASGGGANEGFEGLVPCYDFGVVSTTITLSPDRDQIVQVGQFGVVVMTASNLQTVGLFPPVNNKTVSAALSSDGQSLLVLEDSSAIQLWSVPERKILFTMAADEKVIGMALVPRESGLWIATITDGGVVTLVDPTTQAEVWRVETGQSGPLLVHPDGKSLWLHAGGNLLRLELEAGDVIANRYFRGLSQFSISADGKTMALAANGAVKMVNPDTLDEIATWDGPRPDSVDALPEPILSAVMDSTGESIYATTTRNLYVIDADSGAIEILREEMSGVLSLVGDDALLVQANSTGKKFTLTLDRATGMTTGDLGHTDYTFDVAHLAGNRLVTLGKETEASLWDLDQGRPLGRIGLGWAQLITDPAGSFSAVDGSGNATFYDANLKVNSEVPLEGFVGNNFVGQKVFTITTSHDGKMLIGQASDQSQNVLTYWDAATGNQLLAYQPLTPLRAFERSPTENLMLTGGAAGKATGVIKLWDIATQQELFSLEDFLSPIIAVAFSTDGKSFASSSDFGGLELRSTADGSLIKRITAEGDIGTPSSDSLAFSPKGVLAVTGDPLNRQTNKPGYVTLLDAENGSFVGQLFSHRTDTAILGKLSFSADGRYLVAASPAGGVRVWCLDQLEK